MVDRMTIDRLAGELCSAIGRSAIDACLSQRRNAAVCDALTLEIRRALMRSTLHYYNGGLYYFGGRIYEKMERDDFTNLVMAVLEKAGLPLGLYNRVRTMTELSRAALSGRMLKVDPAVMVFSNCVFDMDGRCEHAFDPRYVAVNKVDYPYNPDMECPQWHWFLDDVLPDVRMQRVLQEFLGAIFIDRRLAKVEKMLVLLGSGANGKSVVAETVRGILGRENITSFGLGDLISGGDLKRNISTINGKRLNYCSEISAREFVQSSDAMKRLVSGEPIMCRDVFQSNFTAYDIPMIMANANQLPAMKKDEVSAITRRMIVIPFKINIPLSRQNPKLADELKSEYPGIFNWVMDGRDRFVRNGYKFSHDEVTDKVMDDYRTSSSSVLEFMVSHKYDCRPRDGFKEPVKVKVSVLYEEYGKWFITSGKPVGEKETLNNFGRILLGAGYNRRPIDGCSYYDIYSDNIRYEITLDSDRGIKTREAKKERPFTDENGVRWVRRRAGLAAALGVAETLIMKASGSMVFNGCYRMDGQAKVYNIEKCRRNLAEFLEGKDKKKIENGKWKNEAVARGKFNTDMKERGEPYRKYSERFMRKGVPEGVVVVPDDWDYFKEIPLEEQKNSGNGRRRKHEIEILNLEKIEEYEETTEEQ